MRYSLPRQRLTRTGARQFMLLASPLISSWKTDSPLSLKKHVPSSPTFWSSERRQYGQYNKILLQSTHLHQHAKKTMIGRYRSKIYRPETNCRDKWDTTLDAPNTTAHPYRNAFCWDAPRWKALRKNGIPYELQFAFGISIPKIQPKWIIRSTSVDEEPRREVEDTSAIA